MSHFRAGIFGALWAVAAAAAAARDGVSVAAAANLAYVLPALDTAFASDYPDIAVTRHTASSGSLVALVENGAPYDVFLSADLDYPQELVRAGGADGKTLVTYAVGKLVLWTTRDDLPLASIPEVVRSASVRHIAIANPRTAPYGRAALECLDRLGLAAAAQPKLVTGESISITAQYVSSGNADVGFVAYSLVLAPGLGARGHWLAVPADLHTPIAQGAVLTRRGAASSAAHRYIDFLTSPKARQVFERFGYGVP